MLPNATDFTDFTDFADYKWRVGRKLGRTIYALNAGSDDRGTDHLLGMMDHSVIAEHVVALHNADLDERRKGLP